MIVTLAGFKGVNGKTTAAVHLAGYLQTLLPALLIDGDPNRSALEWAARRRLPFQVLDEQAAQTVRRDYTPHVVIETQARPTPNDLRALAAGCDLLILPVTLDVLSIRVLARTVEALAEHHCGAAYKRSSISCRTLHSATEKKPGLRLPGRDSGYSGARFAAGSLPEGSARRSTRLGGR
jgi:chromosome partitioning protein